MAIGGLYEYLGIQIMATGIPLLGFSLPLLAPAFPQALRDTTFDFNPFFQLGLQAINVMDLLFSSIYYILEEPVKGYREPFMNIPPSFQAQKASIGISII